MKQSNLFFAGIAVVLGQGLFTAAAETSPPQRGELRELNFIERAVADFNVKRMMPQSGETPKGSGADLELPSSNVSPNPVRLDQRLTIETTVDNIGTAAASNRQLEYYLSTTGEFDSADTLYLLGSSGVSVSAGGRTTTSFTTQPLTSVSGLMEGGYTFGTVIPDENEVWVRSGTVTVEAAAEPDFEAETLSGSPNPVRLDQSLTVTTRLRNVGSGAGNNRRIEFYLSTDETISSSDFFLGADTVSIGAGQAQTAEITVSRLSNVAGLTAGDYVIGIVIPAENEFWFQRDPLAVQSGSGTGSVTIDRSFSGAWFDPTHDGEGFLLQVLSDEQALAVWFTYDPQGNQAWFIAVGQITGNRIDFVEAQIPTGARFGDAFDPDDVVRNIWGDFSFEFSSCNAATMSYSGQWGSGSQILERLWAIDGIPCAAAQKSLNGSLTGAFYDPRRDGEGFLIDVIAEDTAVAYWFTFDNAGNQAWLVGVGTIEGGNILLPDVLITRGGEFGEGFDPDDVVRSPWGVIGFNFTADGNRASMAYGGPASFGAGGYFMVRLTGIADTPVTFDQPARRVQATARVADNVITDGDVNDLNTTESPNDTFSQFQEIPNPAVITGFVTLNETPQGRFENGVDEFDVYRVSLAADQALFMEVSDFDAGDSSDIDLDLGLFRVSDQELVDSSVSITDRESLVVAADGDYYVVVSAFAGASNYRLSIGSSDQLPAKSWSSKLEWVPGEAVLSLPEGTKEADLTALQKTAGFAVKSGNPDRELLVSLNRTKADSGYGAIKARFAAAGFTLPDTPKMRDLYGLKALAQSLPAGATLEPNFIYRALATPDDPFYSLQWHYPQIRLSQAWDIETGSGDVVVAVIDTGVSEHSDNRDTLAPELGADLIRDSYQARDASGIDFDATDPGDLSNPAAGQSSWHGTHVAGTVGASTNNGSGGSGTAWDVTIMPVRVLGRGGSGTSYDIIQGIRWAAGLSNDLGRTPSRRADVINLSLGGGGASSTAESVINQAINRGILVVAAAGNENTSIPSYPAAYNGVISVSASTITDDLAPYSNFGSTVDIAAPGGNSSTDVNADGYADSVLSNQFDGLELNRSSPILGFQNGTSMATPHVAGVAALMKSQYPQMTPEEFDNALRQGELTIDIFGDGAATRNNSFGWGRLDALKAVQWARSMAGGGASLPPILATSTSAVSFGVNVSELSIDVSNQGAGGLSITGASSSRSWLTVSEQTTDGNGLGTYRISVNRAGLVAARYVGTVTFSGSGGTQATVRVSMEVGSTTVPGTSGDLYALFVDTLTGAAATQFRLNEGSTFSISANLLPADYYLLVGTDNDGDRFICDAGEICGAFATLSDIAIFSVEGGNVNLGSFVIDAPSLLQASGSPKNGSQKAVRLLD
ncbi:MAG: S8 family serine peptidase [Pseudomonadota bacterium]